MTLVLTEPGRFALQGHLTFDNAFSVEQQGREQLTLALSPDFDRFEISLHELGQADSSALSVFLSWMRFARAHQIRLCFTDIPRELHALATLCGISELLKSVSCPS